jgi:hypothetical protein
MRVMLTPMPRAHLPAKIDAAIAIFNGNGMPEKAIPVFVKPACERLLNKVVRHTQ